MLQSRLVTRISGGSFNANKGVDVLISQINELQTKSNSMEKSPFIESILSKVNEVRLEILAIKLAPIPPSDAPRARLNPAAC